MCSKRGSMNLVDRIADAWQVLLGKPSNGEALAAEEIASLKRAGANLTIELQEAKTAVTSLRSMVEEMEHRHGTAATDPLEEIFAQVVGPLSQLRLQESLIGGGKQISGQSVMVLASEVGGILEGAGLEPIGRVGEATEFDPALAEPLAAGVALSPGATVVVRFIGYRYKGEVLRKALVDSRMGETSS